MNSKPILLIVGLCSSVALGSLHGQAGGGGAGGGGGSGSSGSSSGASAGSSGASSAAATGASTSGNSAGRAGTASTTTGTTGAKANGANPGISATQRRASRGERGTAPDTSPTLPSRSVLDTARPADATTPAPGERNLPPGLSVPPAQPGISPLSGLPVSDIPAVSRGTEPIGPTANVAATRADGARSATPATAPAQPAVSNPGAIAPHPQTNPRIGTGDTVTVPAPPPMARAEATPAVPVNDAGEAWVPGHYSWVGGQWTWVDGNWQRPPQSGAAWVPGSYDQQSKRWTEGHWSTNALPNR